MPSTLKSKNYFELTYSAIPDNKIEQVNGNYQEISYGESSQSVDVEYVTDCRGSGTTLLPCVTTAEQETTDNVFENVFNDISTSYDNWDDPDNNEVEAERYESVYGKYTIDIYNDKPMRLPNTADNVVVSEATGVYRSRVATGGWLTTLGWLTHFDDADNKIYCIANYNMSGAPSDKEESSNVTGHINYVSVDPYYNGDHLASNNQYLLRITVKLLLLDASMYYYVKTPEEPGDPFTVEGNMNYTLISSFKLTVNYKVRDTEQVDFEYHVDTPNYKDYPLTIKGNEYTNSETTYPIEESGEIVRLPWAEWISKSILSRYHRGKIFINAKIKASYLTENTIDIDSELVVKDINNMLISRHIYGKDLTCIFKVKNIEYNCNGDRYDANIILLEDRLETYQNYVVNSNNIRVVTSNNIKVILYKEEI